MTLTKYQRGDLMEGWNDCPPIMLKANDVEVDLDSNLDISNTIDELLSFPTSLNDTLLRQIKHKLIGFSTKMNHKDKMFVHSLLIQYNSGVPIESLKQQIVEYMMVNDGVSSWCAPLKKLITSLSTRSL